MKIHLSNYQKDPTGCTAWCGFDDPTRIVTTPHGFLLNEPETRCAKCGMLCDLEQARRKGLRAL